MEKPFQTSVAQIVRNLNSAATPALSPVTNPDVRQFLGMPSMSAANYLVPTPQAAPVEQLSLYLGNDCTVPGNAFALGDTICAKITGAPAYFRRLAIINPGGYIVDQATVTNDPETVVFTIPTSITTVFGEETINNRGKWRVASIESADATTRLVVGFGVSDPTQLPRTFPLQHRPRATAKSPQVIRSASQYSFITTDPTRLPTWS